MAMTADVFLGDAKSRLLPASLPFRFFVSAAGFHVLAWLGFVFAAEDLTNTASGPGPLLASLHLLTLGVFAMCAMGASFQLLPVATGQPLLHIWPIKLCFWLFMPGTLLLAWGMNDLSPLALYSGSAGVGGGLSVFALLTADNLRRARRVMPIITAHGWGALIALIGLVVLGLSLVFDFETGFIAERQAIAATHMVVAVFGFMGLLVFGFSQVLIPMFTLSRALPKRLGWIELGLTLSAIVLATVGALTRNDNVLIVAILIGLAASAAYLWLMRHAIRTAMRKRLGLSFVVIRVSWMLLIFSLLSVLAVIGGIPVPNGLALFGFLVMAGWLLTFLTGILQRIIPFLASMHVIGQGGRPPLLSDLTAERPLAIHAVCHFAALAMCSTGIVLDAPLIIKFGAILGLVGAIAFAFFIGFVVHRLKQA
jgi:hypothetical protein